MPRLRVIILDQPVNDSNSYNFLLWADVPAARQAFYASPSKISAWSGALTADNTNLQNGSVVEALMTQRVPSGSTLVQVETFLQNQWTAYQAAVTANNPWIHYGSTWDGTTWNVVTGA